MPNVDNPPFAQSKYNPPNITSCNPISFVPYLFLNVINIKNGAISAHKERKNATLVAAVYLNAILLKIKADAMQILGTIYFLSETFFNSCSIFPFHITNIIPVAIIYLIVKKDLILLLFTYYSNLITDYKQKNNTFIYCCSYFFIVSTFFNYLKTRIIINKAY